MTIKMVFKNGYVLNLKNTTRDQFITMQNIIRTKKWTRPYAYIGDVWYKKSEVSLIYLEEENVRTSN
jgi:hypothetical protein